MYLISAPCLMLGCSATHLRVFTHTLTYFLILCYIIHYMKMKGTQGIEVNIFFCLEYHLKIDKLSISQVMI